MNNPYGDIFPRGEHFPHPSTYETPQAVGELARERAEALLAEPRLNYDSTEMHMRALAGLFNGWGRFDSFTYNRLPHEAKVASRNAADACYGYFSSLGKQEKLAEEFGLLYPNGSQRDQDQFLINAMQSHVSIAGRYESYRRTSEIHRGMYRQTPDGSIMPIEREPAEVSAEQRAGEFPYDEKDIRKVLEAFGQSTGPIIEALYEIAPLNVDRRSIVHHATSCLRAARPASSYQTEDDSDDEMHI